MTLPVLSLLESRVVAVLVEKRHTVPDTYPLTLNALVAGCNQKSSRDPVIEASDADVQAAVDHLRQLSLVVESSGGRVMRYAENASRVLGLPSESVALLATLMLRGPQTPAEIRQNCERLHRFSDVSSVEAYLDELASRPAGPMVVELPRQPGRREARWMHLLCGAPDPSVLATASSPTRRRRHHGGDRGAQAQRRRPRPRGGRPQGHPGPGHAGARHPPLMPPGRSRRHPGPPSGGPVFTLPPPCRVGGGRGTADNSRPREGRGSNEGMRGWTCKT